MQTKDGVGIEFLWSNGVTGNARTDQGEGLSIDRAKGAFLGLALGDAFGRSLEFVHDLQAARSLPVDTRPGAFHWTDDTHMASYLAKAILDQQPGPVDCESFGHAVGRRFVQWLHDPLTPGTAPAGTCIYGTEQYEATKDWHTSGDPHSDGCGA